MTREMLLPTAVAAARSVSLHNHLALVALRQGQGNIDLAGELLKTVYLTHFLHDPENTHATLENVVAAEQSLKASILNAATTGEWSLSDIDCQAIEAILELHDAQLASVPVHRITTAKARLSRILEAGDFPNLAET